MLIFVGYCVQHCVYLCVLVCVWYLLEASVCVSVLLGNQHGRPNFFKSN